MTKGGVVWCHGGGGLGGLFFPVCFLIHMCTAMFVVRCIDVFIELLNIPKKDPGEMCKLEENGPTGPKWMIILLQSLSGN